MKKYEITLTENQMIVAEMALEEYFRLRLGQYMDLCREFAFIGRNCSSDNENYQKVFDSCIQRRDHLEELMRCFFRIAFEPTGYLKEKTEEGMIAECIWDAIRLSLGQSRWDSVLPIGSEPVPDIRVIEDK